MTRTDILILALTATTLVGGYWWAKRQPAPVATTKGNLYVGHGGTCPPNETCATLPETGTATDLTFRARVRTIRRVRDMAVGESARVFPNTDKDGRVFLEPSDRVNEDYMADQVTRVGEDSPVNPDRPIGHAIYPQVRRLKK